MASILPPWINSRLLSLLVVLTYVALVFTYGESGWLIRLVLFLIVPMVCIWFPEAMGSYMGYGLATVGVTEESPPGCILIIGWVLLLLPVIMVAVIWVQL